MKFEIHSFEGALPLSFGMSPAKVCSILGSPGSVSNRPGGALRLFYHSPELNMTINFGGEGQSANEFGFGRKAQVQFRGLDFFGDSSAWKKLLPMSSDYHECFGTLVFCDLGITLNGFHDDYEDDLCVTVFSRGAWEELRPRFEPFSPIDGE